MVTRRYLLHKDAPPSAAKLFLDQTAIPALIDAAAAVETQIEAIAVSARRFPVLACLSALGAGWLLAGLTTASRRSMR